MINASLPCVKQLLQKYHGKCCQLSHDNMELVYVALVFKRLVYVIVKDRCSSSELYNLIQIYQDMGKAVIGVDLKPTSKSSKIKELQTLPQLLGAINGAIKAKP